MAYVVYFVRIALTVTGAVHPIPGADALAIRAGRQISWDLEINLPRPGTGSIRSENDEIFRSNIVDVRLVSNRHAASGRGFFGC